MPNQIGPLEKPTGVVGALLALADLRAACREIKTPHPAYKPGTEPSAADALELCFKNLDHTLRMVGIYLGDLDEKDWIR